MTERIDFSMARLSKLRPLQEGRRTVYDAKTPSLCITITPAGAATFYVFKRISGRPTRVCIGRFPEVTVDVAREQAALILADVARGVNPAESKRKQRGELTLDELFTLYLEFHAEQHKKASSVATDKATFARYLTDWKGRKLSTITNADVRQLHARIGKSAGKYAANRLLSLLSKMFNVATDHGEYKLANPCKGVKAFAEKSRDRFLQPEELPRFLKALETLDNQQAADAFRLMLWTGARKGNVLSMGWADLDLSGETWRVPDTKANEPQLVHLPTEAVDILKKLKPRAKGSQFVFPARRAGAKVGHLQDITQPWDELREAAELPGLRMHDLRRSLGSWMAAGGASLQVIGKTLGHHDPSVTAIYSRLNLDPVRTAVDSAVAAMLAAGQKGGEQ